MPLDLGPLRDALHRWAEDVVDQATFDLVQTVEEAAPVGDSNGGSDGPRVRDSIVGDAAGTRGEVSCTAEHGIFTDQGTRPHRIVGNPLLAFELGGETVIVRFVDHPGTPATGWFSENTNEEAWQRALDSAASAVPFG